MTHRAHQFYERPIALRTYLLRPADLGYKVGIVSADWRDHTLVITTADGQKRFYGWDDPVPLG